MLADQGSTTFKALSFSDWRQFGRVALKFHPRLTVLTGANAAGKTTILNLLNQPLGWGGQFVGTPARKRRGGALNFLSGLRRRLRDHEEASGQVEIGSLTYSDGVEALLSVP